MPEREESESRAAVRQCLGKEAIDDFIGRAVAAHGKKIAKPAPVSVPSEFGRLTGAACQRNLDVNPSLAYAIQRRAGQFAAAAPTRRRIHDREKSCVHGCATSAGRVATEITEAPPLRGPRFRGFARRDQRA